MTNKISRREGLLAFLGFAAAAAIPEAAVEALAVEEPISAVAINAAYRASACYAVNDDMCIKLWSRVLDAEALKYSGLKDLIR